MVIAHTHLELLSNPRGIIEELKEEELVNAEKNFERQELAYQNNPRETKKPNERAFKNKLDKIRTKYDAILEKQGSHIDNKTPYKVATGNASEYSSYLYSKKTKSKDVGMER